jgi:hypothetical protein
MKEERRDKKSMGKQSIREGTQAALFLPLAVLSSASSASYL